MGVLLVTNLRVRSLKNDFFLHILICCSLYCPSISSSSEREDRGQAEGAAQGSDTGSGLPGWQQQSHCKYQLEFGPHDVLKHLLLHTQASLHHYTMHKCTLTANSVLFSLTLPRAFHRPSDLFTSIDCRALTLGAQNAGKYIIFSLTGMHFR